MRKLILSCLLCAACGAGGSSAAVGDAYEPPHASDYGDRNVGVSSYGSGSYHDEEEAEIEDGSHTATVEYYNPRTGHSATYDLDVEVEDGEVIQIDFPNGGWEDDFSPGEIDEDGSAFVEDAEGRQFDISIDP